MENYYETLKYILSLEYSETEWFEYKVNNSKPDMIGEYISALCNSAILEGQDKAYLIYGIDNNKNIIGTEFDLKKEKVGNQELENYLQILLTPRINFKQIDLIFDERKIKMIEIETNTNIPVKFKGIEYIRVNSSKHKLKYLPEK